MERVPWKGMVQGLLRQVWDVLEGGPLALADPWQLLLFLKLSISNTRRRKPPHTCPVCYRAQNSMAAWSGVFNEARSGTSDDI